jgi:hypothetical protein
MRKYGLIVALLIGAGCKSTDGPEPSITTTVLVSSTPNQISVGETAQASAIVKDQNGDPLTGKAVTWTSLNESVATVTSAGLIRGVAPGNATIRGTVDNVTGSATITVIAPSTVCLTGPTIVDPAPGTASIVSSNDAKGCIKVPVSAAASQYLLIAANNNPLPDQVANYSLKSDEGETVPTNTLFVPPLRVAASLSLGALDVPGAVQASFESKLRAMERRELDFSTGKRAMAERMNSVGVRKSVSVAIPAVGEKTTFKVPAHFDANGKPDGGGCAINKFTSVTATVKFVSDRAILYLDDAAPGGGFSDTDFEEIATEFDKLIYPTDVEYFGTPSDLDTNSRIIILYTALVNKLTEQGSGGFVGGFFFVGDLFPVAQCAQSNVAEIFYALAPDPNGTINNNVRTTATVRQGTRGTLAHEFQHMINGAERFRNPATNEFEATWLDEGLAHYAEDLNGRVLRGFTETGNYTDAQMRVNINDYAAFFFQNFARFRFYLANPGLMSPTSAMADTSLAVRGAAWALLRYSADHYSPGGDIKSFIRSLVPGPDTGVVNLTNHAGTSFNELISGWMVANYADDNGIPSLQTKYTYKTYDMRDAVRHTVSNNPALQVYPLQPIVISSTGFGLGGLTARSGSGNYFLFSRSAGGPARSFRLLNSDLTTAATFNGATFILLRTQ